MSDVVNRPAASVPTGDTVSIEAVSVLDSPSLPSVEASNVAARRADLVALRAEVEAAAAANKASPSVAAPVPADTSTNESPIYSEEYTKASGLLDDLDKNIIAFGGLTNVAATSDSTTGVYDIFPDYRGVLNAYVNYSTFVDPVDVNNEKYNINFIMALQTVNPGLYSELSDVSDLLSEAVEIKNESAGEGTAPAAATTPATAPAAQTKSAIIDEAERGKINEVFKALNLEFMKYLQNPSEYNKRVESDSSVAAGAETGDDTAATNPDATESEGSEESPPETVSPDSSSADETAGTVTPPTVPDNKPLLEKGLVDQIMAYYDKTKPAEGASWTEWGSAILGSAMIGISLLMNKIGMIFGGNDRTSAILGDILEDDEPEPDNSNAPDINNLASLKEKKPDWFTAAKDASSKFKIPTSLICGVIQKESNWNAEATPIGKDGKPLSTAKGLGQFTDATWTSFMNAASTDSALTSKVGTPPASIYESKIQGKTATDSIASIYGVAWYLKKLSTYLKLTGDLADKQNTKKLYIAYHNGLAGYNIAAPYFTDELASSPPLPKPPSDPAIPTSYAPSDSEKKTLAGVQITNYETYVKGVQAYAESVFNASQQYS